MYFLWHFPRLTTCPCYGPSCPLEFGLSSCAQDTCDRLTCFIIKQVDKPNSVSDKRTTIIYLGCQLPDTSCNLPRGQMKRAASSPLFGLAPNGVYHAFNVTIEAVSSYLAISPLSTKSGLCIFCGTFHASRRVRVTDHPALWSSDFPHVHKTHAIV